MTPGPTFCSGEKSWALNQDQLSTTHPIVAPINDLNDTYVNFDGITYAKGASVLQASSCPTWAATQFFAGPATSTSTKHAYANATLADLLARAGRRPRAATSRRGAPKVWLEESGVDAILRTEVEDDRRGRHDRARSTLTQDRPRRGRRCLRPHRLASGRLLADRGAGAPAQVLRADRFELDVDGASTVVAAAAGIAAPGRSSW